MPASRISLGLRLPGDTRMRRVLAAYGLCAFIEFSTWLAILLVAYEEGGAILVGVASVGMLVPAIVLVPLLAGFGDRLPRGRALALAHAAVAAMAGVTGALLLAEAPLWSVLVGGALLTVAVGLVRPMHFAATPRLAIRPGDLVVANGLSSFLDGAAIFLGFLLAGVLTDLIGAWVVLLGAAVLGLIATLLTSGLGISGEGVGPAGKEGPGGQIRAALEGFVALRGNWGALALLVLLLFTTVVEGSNDTLTVSFNDQVLGLGAASAGLIAGAYGVGLAIGGATQAGLAHRRRLAPVVLAGALMLGLSELAVAFLGALGPAVVMLALAGLGVSMVVVSARTLLQRGTDSAVLARVLAVQEGVMLIGLTLGAVLGPLAVTVLGPSLAFVPIGLMVIVMGLLAHRTIRSLDDRAPTHMREVSLLSQVPFLAALAPYELEHLAQVAKWMAVPSGVDVVTQGEVGDAFYLVAEGQLSVTVDGRIRAHTLDASDGFGEISLLRRVPRTATITALVDCELLVIGAAQFLGSVMNNTDGAALAAELAADRLAADSRDQPR